MKSLWMAPVLCLILFGCFFGCLGARNHPALEEAAKQGVAPGPFVEAFIEYGAPDEKWAPPPAFILHLQAKDAEGGATPAQVAVTNPAFLETGAGRSPASNSMTAEIAREKVELLSETLLKEAGDFSGCLNPIRVRLVRASGATVEKQGCRGQKGWPRGVSEAVSEWLITHYYGLPTKPLAGVTPKGPKPDRAPAGTEELQK